MFFRNAFWSCCLDEIARCSWMQFDSFRIERGRERGTFVVKFLAIEEFSMHAESLRLETALVKHKLPRDRENAVP